MTELYLTPQQETAVDWMCSHSVGYIVAPPGSGKTITTLMALERLLSQGVITQALIVAAPNVVVSAWCRELQKWPQLRNVTFCVLQGTPMERLTLLEKSCDIRIISDNLCHWLVTAALQNNLSLGQALVVDEITGWGEAGSQRVRQIRKYRNATTLYEPINRRWQYSYGLTATPVSESWEGLYAHFITLDGGARLGTRVDKYESTYFDNKSRATSYKQLELKPDGAQRISKRIADAVYQLPGTQDRLPPMTVTHHKMGLPAKIQDALKILQKCNVLNWGDDQIIAVNAAVLSGKLAQGACGAIYLNTEEGEEQKESGGWVELHRVKMARILGRCQELFPNNVIIVYQYKFELEWLQELFVDATVLTGLPTKQLEKAINRTETAPRSRIILLHPKSGGRGVDGLQCVFSNMLWTAPPWSREQWIQTCGRIWRRGQKNPVNVEVIHAEDSVDAVKWATVEGKGAFEVLFEKYLGDSK